MFPLFLAFDQIPDKRRNCFKLLVVQFFHILDDFIEFEGIGGFHIEKFARSHTQVFAYKKIPSNDGLDFPVSILLIYPGF